jgi:hypothetical protein
MTNKMNFLLPLQHHQYRRQYYCKRTDIIENIELDKLKSII